MTDAFTKMFQQMMASSQEMVRAFNPALENAQMPGLDKGFAGGFPTMPADMMEMWFGKTFNREGLDAKTRLMLTLAALTVLGAQAEPQIRLTVRHLIETGATEREIAEVIWQMSMFGGLPAMQKALEIAQSVFAETREKDA
ncbi:MAG: 4-carboxymuconolactone decarboxylase [Rhodobacteraceae bacterium HLUCCA12]|nr:MAG: 4-carboxymuconolactone decarboxylase [Rhodobacteraceae bacterium HLUCCA12]